MRQNAASYILRVRLLRACPTCGAIKILQRATSKGGRNGSEGRHILSAALDTILRQEQPEKSISFGVTGEPGTTFSGFPSVSRLVVMDEGTQPPLMGTNASARIE